MYMLLHADACFTFGTGSPGYTQKRAVKQMLLLYLFLVYILLQNMMTLAACRCSVSVS